MNFNSKAKSLVILLLGMAFIGAGVYAFSGNNDGMVCEDGANCTFEEASDSPMGGGITTGIEYFQEGLVEGGLTLEKTVVIDSTAAPAGTLVSSEICQYKSLEYAFAATSTGIVANTLYLPTSDSLINNCLYTENDSWTVYFSNENTAAATTTTLAITSGDTMELLEADGSDVVIPGAEDAILHFRNAGGGVVKTTVTSVRAAD